MSETRVVGVVAPVIVAALGNGNDRVAVIHAVSLALCTYVPGLERHPCTRFAPLLSAPRASTASITSTQSITFPSASTSASRTGKRQAAPASRTGKPHRQAAADDDRRYDLTYERPLAYAGQGGFVRDLRSNEN